jgi:hypothetical protein
MSVAFCSILFAIGWLRWRAARFAALIIGRPRRHQSSIHVRKQRVLANLVAKIRSESHRPFLRAVYIHSRNDFTTLDMRN